MVPSCKGKIPAHTIHYVRVGLVILFLLSTMGMVSFQMSSRNLVQRVQDLDRDRCVTTGANQEAKLVAKMKSNPQARPGVSKIPNLSKLKSLRNTLDKVITVVEVSSGNRPPQAKQKKQVAGQRVKGPMNQEWKRAAFQRRIDLKEKEFLKTLNKSHPYYYNGTFITSEEVAKKEFNTMEYVFMNVTRLKPTAAVPLHPLLREEPHRGRALKVLETCAIQTKDNLTTLVDLKRMIREDKHKAVMCVVPKAACTTWKSIMYYLNGRSRLEHAFNVSRQQLVLNYGLIPSLARFSRLGIVERLNTYTKFMVTRHPYQRLVSAYRDKFQKKGSVFMMSYGRNIARRILELHLGGYNVKFIKKTRRKVMTEVMSLPQFQKLTPSKQTEVLDLTSRGFSGNITFEEFLRYGIVDYVKRGRDLDIHWRPQHRLCNPCALNYDFIIRFEDLESDSKKLLNYLQRDDPEKKWIKFHGGNPATVNDNLTRSFFEKISTDLREALRKIYEKDFQLFRYDPNIF